MADARGEHASATFRAKTARSLQLELVGASNPGPGSYNAEKRNNGGNGGLADGRGESAGSAFNSRVPKGGKIMWENRTSTPAPGTYTSQTLRTGSNGTLASTKGESASSAFLSKSVRRVSSSELRQQTGSRVGPGAYSIDKTCDGRDSAMSQTTVRGGSIGTSAFRSDVARDGWLSAGF